MLTGLVPCLQQRGRRKGAGARHAGGRLRPAHGTGRARPQMDIHEKSRFVVTYCPRGLSPLQTDHTYYPRTQKVHPRCGVFLFDIRDRGETHVGYVIHSRDKQNWGIA